MYCNSQKTNFHFEEKNETLQSLKHYLTPETCIVSECCITIKTNEYISVILVITTIILVQLILVIVNNKNNIV